MPVKAVISINTFCTLITKHMYIYNRPGKLKCYVVLGFTLRLDVFPSVNWAFTTKLGNYYVVRRFLVWLIAFLATHLQHRREIRLAAAAKVREKQMVKEMQKIKRTEAKEDLAKDVTADVFLTPAEEKPVHIETEAPEPKVVKKKKHKAFKRQRMQRARR